MKQLRTIWLRLGNLFQRETREREFAEELEGHLQLHIEENLRRGMAPAEARRQALIQLGGVEQTKERVRDRRGFLFLESFLQDLRFGLRMIRKNPGFAAMAILALALGIGANTAVFSAASAFLRKPVSFPE